MNVPSKILQSQLKNQNTIIVTKIALLLSQIFLFRTHDYYSFSYAVHGIFDVVRQRDSNALAVHNNPRILLQGLFQLLVVRRVQSGPGACQAPPPLFRHHGTLQFQARNTFLHLPPPPLPPYSYQFYLTQASEPLHPSLVQGKSLCVYTFSRSPQVLLNAYSIPYLLTHFIFLSLLSAHGISFPPCIRYVSVFPI